jgi:hypothetical protein
VRDDTSLSADIWQLLKVFVRSLVAEELVEAYKHTDRMRNSIMIILILIVIITICFELACGWSRALSHLSRA